MPLACAAHRNGGFLNAGLFKLEAGDALRTGGRLGLGEVFQGFPDAFVIALTMILTAEIFVEEPSQRPQIFATILTPHYSFFPSFTRFHYIGKIPYLKKFSDDFV